MLDTYMRMRCCQLLVVVIALRSPLLLLFGSLVCFVMTTDVSTSNRYYADSVGQRPIRLHSKLCSNIIGEYTLGERLGTLDLSLGWL